MTAATYCHETVIVVTLNIRARLERLIPTALALRTSQACFCVILGSGFASHSDVQDTPRTMIV
jgi:hypothetical protein